MKAPMNTRISSTTSIMYLTHQFHECHDTSFRSTWKIVDSCQPVKTDLKSVSVIEILRVKPVGLDRNFSNYKTNASGTRAKIFLFRSWVRSGHGEARSLISRVTLWGWYPWHLKTKPLIWNQIWWIIFKHLDTYTSMYIDSFCRIVIVIRISEQAVWNLS